MTEQTETTSTALVPVEKGGTIGGDKANNKSITGRPTKLTPALQDKICQLIAKGNYLITACNVVGINKSTYLRWVERAEQETNNGGGLYCDFGVAIKKAEGEAEAQLAQFVRETAIDKKDGYLGMTFLERRHPDRWGRKDRSIVSIDEHKTITITTVEVVKDYGNRKIEEKGEK